MNNLSFTKLILPLLFMVLVVGSSSTIKSDIEVVSLELSEGIKFEIETNDARMLAMVRSMRFNKQNKHIDIETAKTIVNVQFLDFQQEMIFTVPVGTSTLNIGMSSYPKGVYYLKLLLEDENNYLSTRIIKDF